MTKNRAEENVNGKDKPYDLEERTAIFAEAVIALMKKVPVSPVTRRLIDQLVGASMSVGANYCEANNASSKKDFRNKIFICKKEIQETKYWLEMLAEASPEEKENLKEFWKEAHEITLIFNKIASSLKN